MHWNSVQTLCFAIKKFFQLQFSYYWCFEVVMMKKVLTYIPTMFATFVLTSKMTLFKEANQHGPRILHIILYVGLISCWSSVHRKLKIFYRFGLVQLIFIILNLEIRLIKIWGKFFNGKMNIEQIDWNKSIIININFLLQLWFKDCTFYASWKTESKTKS